MYRARGPNPNKKLGRIIGIIIRIYVVPNLIENIAFFLNGVRPLHERMLDFT
jgi:hypothetical protein